MKNYTALILVVLISVHAMPINNSMLTSQTVHEAVSYTHLTLPTNREV